jgi:hypothetical protein
MNGVTQRDAKLILRSLGTSGQPPKWGASAINVGTDRFLRRLSQEYLQDYCAPFEGQDGGGICKWIEADYGNGKTQFLRCVQEMAWQENYVTAFVELSQDECPLDRPDRVFAAVSRAIQAPQSDPTQVDCTRGLDVVLEQLLDRKFPGVLTGLPDENLRDMAVQWANDLRSVSVESTALLTAAVTHLTSLLAGNEELAQISRTFLRGETIPASELKRIGVYEKLDKSTGFRMLRSMCQLLQRARLANGVVLLFDEARRTLSLMTTKAQKVACENLLSVINRCNSGELPGTIFLYAVMPEFFTNFATNYPALQQRCGPATRINLNHLQGIRELDLLTQISKRISALFQTAYDDFTADSNALEENAVLIATAAIQASGGTGTRRLFVRSWIQHLNDARFNGLPRLDRDAAEAIVDGASEQLRSAEAAEVEEEGE